VCGVCGVCVVCVLCGVCVCVCVCVAYDVFHNNVDRVYFKNIGDECPAYSKQKKGSLYCSHLPLKIR